MPDAATALARRLRRAPTAELRRLVEDHGRELGLREVRQALLNPFVDAEAIEALAGVRRLVGVYEVRAALARHRRTPAALAMRFLPGLYWRDLLEVSIDVRLAGPVRRVADKYLVQRLPRLAVGEKIALARRAGGPVLAELRRDRNPRVIAAWLENPRLTEDVVVPLAADAGAPPRVLDLLAADERWGVRYDVRAALSRNPRAPFRVILAILPTLRRQDLEAVLETPDHSSVVENRVRELLG